MRASKASPAFNGGLIVAIAQHQPRFGIRDPPAEGKPRVRTVFTPAKFCNRPETIMKILSQRIKRRFSDFGTLGSKQRTGCHPRDQVAAATESREPHVPSGRTSVARARRLPPCDRRFGVRPGIRSAFAAAVRFHRDQRGILHLVDHAEQRSICRLDVGDRPNQKFLVFGCHLLIVAGVHSGRILRVLGIAQLGEFHRDDSRDLLRSKRVGHPVGERVDRGSCRYLRAFFREDSDRPVNHDETRKLPVNILKNSGEAAALVRKAKSSWAAMSRSRKAGTGLLVATAVPVLIMLGGLSVDESYVTMRASLLRRTAQSAALAGEQYLSTFYTTGSSSAVNTAVQTIATTNMPSGPYGTVVPTSNATFTATTTNPTAVKVTALSTAANGNPVHTFFGGTYGKPTVDVSSSAIASYGTGKAFNTIILNDLSMSFSSEVSDQQAADLAILNCVSGAASTTSQLGLTGFTGHSQTLIALGNAVTNLSTMTTYINHTLNYCGSSHMPGCSGSNVAAGLYSAITQLQAAGLANSSSNIILITDGVPNADAIAYVKADGTYPTPTSLLPVCTVLCSDANLWTMAQDQAAYAKTLGINISTIYYSGDTSGSANKTAYATALQSLVTGTGIALVAPNASQIDASFGAFCASMGSAVKMVN